jgi:hypothetical protein
VFVDEYETAKVARKARAVSGAIPEGPQFFVYKGFGIEVAVSVDI